MKPDSETNVLSDTPVGRLIVRMSLPGMVSMLALALVNLFQGTMASSSPEGLDAVSAAYPFEALMTAFAIGLGLGTGSAVSRSLGKGDSAAASEIAATGVFLAIVTGIGVGAAGAAFVKVFVNAFPISEEAAEEAVTYLYIVTAAVPVTVTHTLFNKISISSGMTFRPMLAIVAGAALTLAVDYFLISGAAGIRLKTLAALAIGNVSGQSLTLVTALAVVRKAPVNVFFRRGFRLKRQNVKSILAVGVPSVIQNAVGALFLTALNAILANKTCFNIYSAFYKVQSLAYMPGFGLNQGSMPIMGYAYGAGNKKRFVKTLKLTLAAAVTISAIVFAAAEIFPEEILKAFKADGEMLAEGETAFRILSATFVPAAFSLILAAMFASTGHGGKAMTLNVLRGAALGLPAAYFLKKYVSINAAWIGIAAAEIIVPALFVPVAILTFKKIFASEKKKPRPESDAARNH